MLEKFLDLFPEQEETKPNKFTIYMGEAIKQAREEMNFSQEEMARLIYRRRATLSDIETGKADVDAGTLWLLSAYLKKPLSYFYPPYARENMRPEEMGDLEHELQMHFMAIRSIELQKLAVQVIKDFAKFEPVDMIDELEPYLQDMRISRAHRKRELEAKEKRKNKN